jgi:hypothetical protein
MVNAVERMIVDDDGEIRRGEKSGLYTSRLSMEGIIAKFTSSYFA